MLPRKLRSIGGFIRSISATASQRGYQGSAPQRSRRAAAIFNPIRMAGVSVIDIGAGDGFYSFEGKHRGAGHVLATDHYCWNHEALRGRETFEFARSALGLDIEMLDIDVPDLSVEKVGGQFDVVLFLGVFYHLIDPIDGLRRAASLAKDRPPDLPPLCTEFEARPVRR
jgi:2-polyprenyl-3-methyl-5-hydroxy-6-metoxy-1,4-benzoquinol methylase